MHWPTYLRSVAVTFLIAITVAGIVLFIGLGIVHSAGSHHEPLRRPSTTLSAPSEPTTTTAPYADLQASLDNYCAAKGRGRGVIEIRNGAPLGTCERD